MTKPRAVPLSGYAIEKVYTDSLTLLYGEPGEPETHGAIDIGWDWRLLPDQRFEVRLTVTVDPSADRSERLEASVIGRFHTVSETPSVPMVDFVSLQAVAMLLPYVRQVLSNLTLLSWSGVYYLPPINVANMMHDFDKGDSIGARQLAMLRAVAEQQSATSQANSQGEQPAEPKAVESQASAGMQIETRSRSPKRSRKSTGRQARKPRSS